VSARSIVHIEFSAQRPAEAAKFYAELFGWQAQRMPEADYYTFDAPVERGGGFTPLGGELDARPGEVIVYVATDDIDQTLAHAELLGARTEVARTAIGAAWYAVFRDPSGIRVGLYQNGRT
jgi:predicted enzyme related to lactoylglutathione lyase